MDVTERLKELGVKPAGGQHFLQSESQIQQYLSHAETDGKTVLEIGAGTGAITEKVEASKIYAVEKDTVLAEGLQELEFDKEVEVVNEDFLEMEIPEDVEYMIGNIPFEISSDILEKTGREGLPATYIVQEEFADKVVASPGDPDYSFQSFRNRYYFLPVKTSVIPASAYHPEPEVSTAVLKLFPNRERHGIEDGEALLEFARALFTHRMKKVRNAFVDARHMLDISKDEAKEIRDELPHSEKRVNNLEVAEAGEILEAFQEMQKQFKNRN